MTAITQHINTKMDVYTHPSKFMPTGLMFHSTAAKGCSAQRFADRWNVPHLGKSVNFFVDGVSIIQIVPTNYRVGHCAGSANRTHIAFEICEPPANLWSDPTECMKYYNNAVQLTVMLCKQYNIKPVKPYLITHCEGHALGMASNHADVMHWFPKFGKSADTFRADVAAGLQALITPPIIVPMVYPTGVVVNVKAGDKLNIRNSGSMLGKVIGTVPPGAKLQVVKLANADWYEVIYNGIHGYVGKNFIQVQK